MRRCTGRLFVIALDARLAGGSISRNAVLPTTVLLPRAARAEETGDQVDEQLVVRRSSLTPRRADLPVREPRRAYISLTSRRQPRST
ncbi:hypothetical protein ACWGN5_36600 [Streptomyces sp. NPDC055815]